MLLDTIPASTSLASMDAEQSVLGSILINPACFPEVKSILGKSEVFFYLKHRWIWQAMDRLHEAGQLPEYVAVHHELTAEQLRDIGGVAYLTQLTMNTPTSTHVFNYAQIVARGYLRRDLTTKGQALIALAASEESDMPTIKGKTAALVTDWLGAVARMTETGGGLKAIEDFLAEDLDTLEQSFHGTAPQAFSTGLADLDRMIGGLQPGRLYMIGGRPGMGKSALVLNIAYHLSKTKGFPVAYYSLEMKANSLRSRMVAIKTGIPIYKQNFPKEGGLTNEEFEAAYRAQLNLQGFPFYVNDSGAQTFESIKNDAKDLMDAKGVKLAALVIDYRDLVTLPDHIARQSEKSQAEYASRTAKMLAFELECPVLMVTKLNKAMENRDDKRPRLADLSQGGDYDADVFAGIYWEGYYDESIRQQPAGRVSEVIILKNRDGMTGTSKLYWDATRGYFGNLEGRDQIRDVAE